MSKTTIEWTDDTWNPLRGCSRISEGCRHCYAEQIAGRFSGSGQPFHGFATRRGGVRKWTGKVALLHERLADPLSWRGPPRHVFVNSMSDLFHEALFLHEVMAIFGVMALAEKHTFQVLTKRAALMRRAVEAIDRARLRLEHDSLVQLVRLGDPDRPLVDVPHVALRDLDPRLRDFSYVPLTTLPFPPPNVWLGVSVEDDTQLGRVAHLRKTPAAVRFMSYEPALGPLGDIRPYLVGDGRLDWVIAGAESGRHARPMQEDWVRDVRDQCKEAGVAFFYKQSAEKGKKRSLPLLDGVQHTAMPEVV